MSIICISGSRTKINIRQLNIKRNKHKITYLLAVINIILCISKFTRLACFGIFIQGMLA